MFTKRNAYLGLALLRLAGNKAREVLAKSRAVMMSFALGASLALPAFATENDASDMTKLVNSTDTITQMVGKVWELLMANPLLTLFVASSLLSMGIGFFMYLKRAARR